MPATVVPNDMVEKVNSIKQQARERLLEVLKPGDTVQTVLRHVSASGMTRRIDLFILKDGNALYLSHNAANLLGMRVHERGGIVIGGCGMDMGFALVYDLSQSLWPNGHGCTGNKCPSNDHSNGDRDYRPHEDHTGGDANHICAKEPETCKAFKHWHRDGGYALRQSWL